MAVIHYDAAIQRTTYLKFLNKIIFQYIIPKKKIIFNTWHYITEIFKIIALRINVITFGSYLQPCILQANIKILVVNEEDKRQTDANGQSCWLKLEAKGEIVMGRRKKQVHIYNTENKYTDWRAKQSSTTVDTVASLLLCQRIRADSQLPASHVPYTPYYNRFLLYRTVIALGIVPSIYKR